MNKPRRGRNRVYRQTTLLKVLDHLIQHPPDGASSMDKREVIKLRNDIALYTPLEVEGWFKNLNIDRIQHEQ